MSPDRRARVRDRGNIWARLCCASTGIYERTQPIKVLRLRSVGAPSPPYKGSVKTRSFIYTMTLSLWCFFCNLNVRVLRYSQASQILIFGGLRDAVSC